MASRLASTAKNKSTVRNKATEYDPDAALAPPEGASVKPADPVVGASIVTELNGSDKVGSGGPDRKPMLALGAGEQLINACGIDTTVPDGRPDPGLIIASDTRAGDGRLRRRHRHASALRQRNRSATRVRTRAAATRLRKEARP